MGEPFTGAAAGRPEAPPLATPPTASTRKTRGRRPSSEIIPTPRTTGGARHPPNKQIARQHSSPSTISIPTALPVPLATPRLQLGDS